MNEKDSDSAQLLVDVIDDRECNYDEAGDCKVHDYFPFSLWNRWKCPNQRGQELLDKLGFKK